jgi:hypothetical protein
MFITKDAFHYSLDKKEVDKIIESIHELHRTLPQPASRSTRTVVTEIRRTGAVSVKLEYTRDSEVVFSYTVWYRPNSALAWVEYYGDEDDFGYGDIALLRGAHQTIPRVKRHAGPFNHQLF